MTKISSYCLGIVLSLTPLTLKASESSEFADKVISAHGLTEPSAGVLRKLLTSTPQLTRNIGTEDLNTLQGPNNTWHPASRAQCKSKVLDTHLIAQNTEYERICGAKWMAPVPDYPGQRLDQTHTCIDQFEFPDIPCEYPVVWLTAPTERQICEAMGKRVCNSDEWEGACAGSKDSPDSYYFSLGKDGGRNAHNSSRQLVWAYQFIDSLKLVKDSREECGVYTSTDPDISEPMHSNVSRYYAPGGQSAGCNPAGNPYTTCGTNTWPAGYKYDCRSSQDVFDMHGNVAETVNLPTQPSEMAGNGRGPGGLTEHKGSFFVYRPQYPDDCRVRQPFEHWGSFATNQMAFYQEGFRCCKDVQ